MSSVVNYITARNAAQLFCTGVRMSAFCGASVAGGRATYEAARLGGWFAGQIMYYSSSYIVGLDPSRTVSKAIDKTFSAIANSSLANHSTTKNIRDLTREIFVPSDIQYSLSVIAISALSGLVLTGIYYMLNGNTKGAQDVGEGFHAVIGGNTSPKTMRQLTTELDDFCSNNEATIALKQKSETFAKYLIARGKLAISTTCAFGKALTYGLKAN